MTIGIQEKFLNAINVLVSAKIGALANIFSAFSGNWERAWHSDLQKFCPRDVDWKKTKEKIDPEAALRNLAKENISLLNIKDKSYPELLKHISDPPFVLYVKGSTEILNSQCFGVVGTRRLTEYGQRATPFFVKDLVAGGFTIVSGLALGVDTFAHRGTLENEGKAIAVLGTGSDERTIYPTQNLKLARDIVAKGGAIITEYAPKTHGTSFTFPQRNRIISGLSKGVLVIEADIKSGALITAKNAVDQNRDLFCVPGSIYSVTSQGTNFMIKKGAKLVASGEDILEDYGISATKVRKCFKPSNEVEAKIMALLDREPLTNDEIIRNSGFDTAKVNIALTIMELEKKIKCLGSGKFVLYN